MIREFPLKEDIDLEKQPTEAIQTKDIPILECNSAFDTHIDQNKCTLKEIAEYIENPNITESKEKNGLWCFGECLDPEKGHQKSNIVNKSKFFILDYDSGYTIEEFCEEYKDYFFMLYTSFSHTKEHHKFRVIMYGNHEAPLNDDEQYAILSECFRNADRTTLQPNRIFYKPAHKAGAEYRFKFNVGKQFPLYNEAITFLVTKRRVDKAKEEAQDRAFATYHRKKRDVDCLNCPSVKNYLNTSYPNTTGNGDSNLNLYKAIFCCIKYGDDNALAVVENKAKSEHWTTSELRQKEEAARRAL